MFPVQSRVVLRGYDEFADLPEDRNIQVYALEEIVAEKVLALSDPARNEPRDLYDLWYLTTHANMEINDLVVKAIVEKLAFREKTRKGIEVTIAQKGDRLEALWTNRLAYQMAKLPPFDEVFRNVRRTLRQAPLP